MKIKALIFDYDGLLVNTQELLVITYNEVLKRAGKKLEKVDYAVMYGRPGIVNMQYLKEKYGLEGTAEELYEQRRKIDRTIIENEIVLMEGVEDLLKTAKALRLKCGIGSGGKLEVVLFGLRKMGLLDYFSEITTSDDLVTSKGKPDPELFLIAAKKLNVKPEECIVLDDAPNGIEAAKAAGMKTVFVPDPRFIDPHHDQADLILKTLKGVTREVLESLGKK